MKLKILTLMLGIVLFNLNCFSQLNYQTITEEFFKTYSKNPLDAYEYLFQGNKWIEKSKIEKSKIDFREFLKDLGEYCGYELIASNQLGDSYVISSFLVKYERQPYRIELEFYKPKEDWKIQNFSYDTNFDDEFEESLRYDRLMLLMKN